MDSKFAWFLALATVGLAALSWGAGGEEPARPAARREPLGLEVRKNIRVVYQIKTDEWKEDVAAGLHYLRKLGQTYDRLDIPSGEQHIHGVFHGKAGYFLLTDEAYARHTGQPGGNPNREIVAELLQRGVSVELCASTMKDEGWKDEDVLPGVTIVVGAYPRIIDLQLQGYAYIRF